MTTDELLNALPIFIGRNPIYNDKEEIIGYAADNKNEDIGWLCLRCEGKCWRAFYKSNADCIFALTENNLASFYGITPQMALQNLYNWCIIHNIIKPYQQ